MAVALCSLAARQALAQNPPAAVPAVPAAPAAAPPAISPAALAASPGAALPATEDNKPARTAGAGFLSPNVPQIGAGAMVNSKEASETLTPTTTGASADEWKFSFHGYLRGPMRFSWGPPTTTKIDPNTGPGFMPSDAPPGTQLHGKPRVPGASYITWEYTNTVPDPWAQLNFSFGNSRAMMTIIVDSYGQTSAGYRNLQSQQGIDQAFVTLNFPEAFGDHGGLVLNVGSFQNRYGTAGKYDGGMYETYLFGRTHVGGATLTANIDTGSEWGLTVEGGGGTKLEVIPFTNTQLFQLFKGASGAQDPMTNQGYSYPRNLSDREAEYLPYSGPVPQGSTFLAHLHFGASYKKMWTFGLHALNSWSPDDNWDMTNSNQPNTSDMLPRATAPSPGRMTVLGAEARLNGGVYGDGYLGFSYIDAKNILVLADALEVLHSFGGWQFKQNYFGVTFNPHTGAYLGPQNESGTVKTLSFQYTFSFAALARYPAGFWGDGPDLTATVFANLALVDSPPPVANPMWDMSTKKLKYGADVLYTPLPWFGVGGRFDHVQPDLDAKMGGNTLNFAVFSPRAVFRTAFVTHEAVTVMYQHYFLSSASYPIYPYQWVPKADADLLAVSATMWW
ncbi:MAG: hypothetical protein ABUS79_04285 [Pseudomonadota bacterium]